MQFLFNELKIDGDDLTYTLIFSRHTGTVLKINFSIAILEAITFLI